MTLVDRIGELKKQELVLRREVGLLENELNRDGWAFHIHVDCEELRISAWKRGDSATPDITFLVEQDHVEIYRVDVHTPNWREVEAILNKYLFRT